MNRGRALNGSGNCVKALEVADAFEKLVFPRQGMSFEKGLDFVEPVLPSREGSVSVWRNRGKDFHRVKRERNQFRDCKVVDATRTSRPRMRHLTRWLDAVAAILI